jgi:membrane protein
VPAVNSGRRPRNVRALVHRAWTYLCRIYKNYGDHQCALMASACAYCAMLSLVPLLVVAIAGLGFFLGGNEESTSRIIDALQTYVPNNPAFVTGVRSVLDHVLQDRHMLGVLGMIGLIWAAHQVFLTMEQTMNVIHGVAETRHWIRQRLIAVGAAFGTLIVLIVNVYVVASYSSLEGHIAARVPLILHVLLNRAVAVIVPTLVIWSLFTALYQSLPACSVRHRDALVGAGVAAVLWHASLIGFGIYLQHSHGYDRLYGPLAGLAILVVWCYYCMAILLLGAEVSADLGKKNANVAR